MIAPRKKTKGKEGASHWAAKKSKPAKPLIDLDTPFDELDDIVVVNHLATPDWDSISVGEREPHTYASSAMPATVKEFFAVDGPLQQLSVLARRTYEERPQQVDMALAVADALLKGRHLAVEAPTGVGKTFSYLVPAIIHARLKMKPVVVTTHTINLQEQIVNKDLPLLRSVFDRGLRYALAKGRQNYLCQRRLALLTAHPQELLPGLAVSELDQIIDWSRQTQTGDRSELRFEPSKQIWETVCCEPWNCLKSKCPCFKSCFLMQARRKLSDADIIVANHALYFADLRMKLETEAAAQLRGEAAESMPDSLIPDYAAVIFDEGHTLEDAAADHLGLRLSSIGLRRILDRLYSGEKGRGLLYDFENARLIVIAAAEKADLFFGRLREWLLTLPQSPLRYTEKGYLPDLLSASLERVESELRVIAGEFKNDPEQTGFVQELIGLQQQLFDFRLNYQRFIHMELEGCVYWIETTPGSLPGVSFNAVPVELGPMLRGHVFEKPFTVIITSATLAVNRSMDYFLKRLGGETCDSLVLSSPFDFRKQVKLYLSRSLPEPNAPEFLAAACREIQRFMVLTHGKAFVLFTSHKMMQDAAALLSSFFDAKRIKLMVQGEGLPRSQMLEAFKNDTDSVIFGTNSFWTGVDVPGEALSNVIIVRLPFAVPDHPVIAARQELIEQRGGRSFTDYSVPEAILRFRQGFGRLIRSKTDTGIVVVLDNRILTKPYGRLFLDSLPQCDVEEF
jgi:ATP-dependent DNA helicase DinG